MRKYLVLVFCLLFPSSTWAEEYDTLLQIIVDDTGGLQDTFDQSNQSTARDIAKKVILAKARERGRGDYLAVVSQYHGSNVWVGDPRKIRNSSNSRSLQRHFESEWGGCSDLHRIFDTISENAYLYPAEEYEIVIFSSLAHTGIPCTAVDDGAINSLQDEFFEKLKGVASRLDANFTFYWMYDFTLSTQKKQMVEFQKGNTGIKIKAYTEAETRALFP